MYKIEKGHVQPGDIILNASGEFGTVILANDEKFEVRYHHNHQIRAYPLPIVVAGLWHPVIEQVKK